MKARELGEKNNRISISEGQAGHSDGHNSFEEIRVSKEAYHALRVQKLFCVFQSFTRLWFTIKLLNIPI